MLEILPKLTMAEKKKENNLNCYSTVAYFRLFKREEAFLLFTYFSDMNCSLGDKAKSAQKTQINSVK